MLVKSGCEILEITQKRGLAPMHWFICYKDQPYGARYLICQQQRAMYIFWWRKLTDWATFVLQTQHLFRTNSLHYFFTTWFVRIMYRYLECILTPWQPSPLQSVQIFAMHSTISIWLLDLGVVVMSEVRLENTNYSLNSNIISLATIAPLLSISCKPFLIFHDFCLILN